MNEVSFRSTSTLLPFLTGTTLAREQIVVVQQHEQSVNQALIQLGLLGVSPIEPTVAIDLEVLELYYRLRRRHSRFGILPFVRALCDLQKVRHLVPKFMFEPPFIQCARFHIELRCASTSLLHLMHTYRF